MDQLAAVFQAEILAYAGRYQDAAKAFTRAGKVELAIDLFADLRQWEEAKLFAAYLNQSPRVLLSVSCLRNFEKEDKAGAFLCEKLRLSRVGAAKGEKYAQEPSLSSLRLSCKRPFERAKAHRKLGVFHRWRDSKSRAQTRISKRSEFF